jgi:hypothetical protein
MMRFSLFVTAFLLAAAPPGVRGEEPYSFGTGARGFLVRDYNERLLTLLKERARPPKKLDQFGKATIENTRLVQAGLGDKASPPGRAGQPEFEAVGLAWPDGFTRCVNLIDCWEGTFAKLEGSAESDDNFPNVTFGIVGFTSHDGSLQEFLQQANAASAGAVFKAAREQLSAPDAASFIELVASYRPDRLKKNHEEFVKFAIRNPQAPPEMQQPRPEIAKMFAAFERIAQFREIQLAATRKKCWDDELPDYRERLFGTPRSRSLQTDLFCFDMTILTNGPGKKAWRKLEKMPWKDDHERMNQVFAVMRESPEFKGDEEKRVDVLERERCIIDGHGEVHEDDYDLRAFALLPSD